jgi:hypothetical protein
VLLEKPAQEAHVKGVTTFIGTGGTGTMTAGG